MSKEDAFYARLLDQLYDGVYFVDRDLRITYWNRAAERITGFSAKEVVHKPCSDNVMVHTDQQGRSLCDPETCPAMRAMRLGQPVEEEVWLRHKEGHRVAVLTRISPIRDDQGRVVGAAEVFTDSAARLSMAERLHELEKLAVTDPLTGLGNRRFAEQSIANQLHAFDRYGWAFGLLFMDVDRFKQINDANGHRMGDKVLKLVAKTLAANVRAHDLACRWGGDELLVLLLNVTPSGLKEVANKLRGLVSRSSYSTSTGLQDVSVSMGATLARHGDTAETIIRRADELMYRSKRAGGNQVTLDTGPGPETERDAPQELHGRHLRGELPSK